ncbi:membrane protein [soil metagenome]
MTTVGVVLALVLLLLVGLWLTWTANRLDRMHHRIDVARGTLDSQLLRRSGATLELASSEALDPPSRLVLLDAAHQARNAGPDEFESAESALSQALRAVFADADDLALLREEDAGVTPLVDELARDCVRVELARRFHNDVVVSARALRSRRRVRWLRLAGHAAELRAVDLDDVPPAGWS